MKKIVAILLTLIMVVGLCTVASAADTYSITINQKEEGHTYDVYQIFAGDVSQDDGKLILANIVWGSGVTADGQAALGNAKELADDLETAADAEAFADEVAAYLSATYVTAVYSEGSYTVDGLDAGYYLIKDRDDSLADEEGYTAYILKVVGDTVADPKDGETTVEKKVDDKNDSNTSEDEIVWHDSADHDIGDKIDFKIEATIADNYDEFDTYYLTFHDTEEKGLTFDASSVKVYVDGALIESGYELVTEPEDGCTFEVVFEDLKQIEAVSAGSVITVQYRSTLNSDAVVGSMGNVNKVYGEFSNNPNDEQGGRGRTQDDAVIVFTYETVVKKVDENEKPLTGAAFTLEKFVVDANGTDEYNGVAGTWTAISTVETEPQDVFTFTGLDDGEYRLVETKAPEHYNKIQPIYFTVTAEHEIEWNGQQREDVLTSLTGDVATGVITFTADKDAGTLETSVVNERGIVLPETGGMGTTIFYIIGAVLVLGAIAFLVTRKRVNTEK